MTRGELIVCGLTAIVLGLAAGIVIISTSLSRDGVIAVTAIGASLCGVVAGIVSARVDRRERERVH